MSAPQDAVAAVLVRFEARAAGLWRLEGDRLTQVVFFPAADLDADVASRFGEATRSVSMDQEGLGIVRAVLDGLAAISHAAGLPAESGSGYWLRAFGADRSIAVPLRSPPRGVLSVALAGEEPSDAEVAGVLTEIGSGLV